MLSSFAIFLIIFAVVVLGVLYFLLCGFYTESVVVGGIAVLNTATASKKTNKIKESKKKKTGGGCGAKIYKLSDGKLTKSENHEDIHKKSDHLSFTEGLAKFRKTKKECDSTTNDNNLCDDLIEFYKDLSDDLPKKHHDKTVIGIHYTDWCEKCGDLIPIINSLRNELCNGGDNKRYVFIDIDEDEDRTPGINSVPQLIKYDPVNNKIFKYEGKKDYEDIKTWLSL
jgi:hypothetical protein